MGTCCNGRYSDLQPIMQTPSRKIVSGLVFACAEGCSQQRDCSGLSPDYPFHSIRIEPVANAKIQNSVRLRQAKHQNNRTSQRPFHLTMVYFVAVNNVEGINNEINGQHESVRVT